MNIDGTGFAIGHDYPLEQMAATSEGIYTIDRVSTATQVRLLDRSGYIPPIALPFIGANYTLDGIAGTPGILLSLENYVTPRAHLLVRDGQVTDTHLGVLPAFPTSAYTMDSMTVTARDGTRVPLDIVRRRDLRKMASAPSCWRRTGPKASTSIRISTRASSHRSMREEYTPQRMSGVAASLAMPGGRQASRPPSRTPGVTLSIAANG